MNSMTLIEKGTKETKVAGYSFSFVYRIANKRDFLCIGHNTAIIY